MTWCSPQSTTAFSSARPYQSWWEMRGSCPFSCTGKSMMVVVPPIAAATVPE